jgi:hypothetical protein
MAAVSSDSIHLLPRLLGRRGLTTANSGAANGESLRCHSFSIGFMLRGVESSLICNSDGGGKKCTQILVGTHFGKGHLQEQEPNGSTYLNSSSENRLSVWNWIKLAQDSV